MRLASASSDATVANAIRPTIAASPILLATDLDTLREDNKYESDMMKYSFKNDGLGTLVFGPHMQSYHTS